MQGRPVTTLVSADAAGIAIQWPHLSRFLWVDNSTGRVKEDYPSFLRAEDRLSPAAQAAAYEEWADFYEWRPAQRADELAGDRVKRHLVEKWTGSIRYSYLRCAAAARGEEPGEWTPQWVRRPDLDAEGQSIVAEILPRLDANREPVAHQHTVAPPPAAARQLALTS